MPVTSHGRADAAAAGFAAEGAAAAGGSLRGDGDGEAAAAGSAGRGDAAAPGKVKPGAAGLGNEKVGGPVAKGIASGFPLAVAAAELAAAGREEPPAAAGFAREKEKPEAEAGVAAAPPSPAAGALAREKEKPGPDDPGPENPGPEEVLAAKPPSPAAGALAREKEKPGPEPEAAAAGASSAPDAMVGWNLNAAGGDAAAAGGGGFAAAEGGGRALGAPNGAGFPKPIAGFASGTGAGAPNANPPAATAAEPSERGDGLEVTAAAKEGAAVEAEKPKDGTEEPPKAGVAFGCE
jgi:hypothetical protein